MANYGPHQYVCSTQGSSPVKIKHISISRALAALPSRLARAVHHARPGSSPRLQPWPSSRRPSIPFASSATAAFPRKPFWRGSLPTPATPTTPSPSSAISTRCGTPRTSKICASSARTRKRASSSTSSSGKSPPSARSTTRASTPSPCPMSLDRFKKEKVGLSVESQYDPAKIMRAETVLKDILSEHGHQFATIKTRGQDHSSGLGAGELQHQGRPHGEGGRDQVHRQPAHQRRSSCAAP